MAWGVTYHPDTEGDFDQLGSAAANRIFDVIEQRIANGEPDKSGKSLSGSLAGCRRIRTGDTRIVYRVDGKAIVVLIIAVGARRDSEVYDAAKKRV
ncbi:type II toxin-antitoxin system RelE/ParE family toxin [Pseudomonas sp. FP198]|jgi:mRNA interferase RelE/StbE|uniref:type II toxin-antitoxin system RelE family toxin n=1 Tax=Pseudomonas sp. FP198 TaxID=2954084 RepID=UPI00273604CA|nr:type II toxin-antitoxin system RelE/ParE family toxin [Pseudomonas sp. FP198]WLG94560.1 type II toxin-antitoxin system RelE/ParE family toxin [Pseudomonas sp. FP198]